jgi:16S rRNA (uracil1498-N3)-methyltransferase
MRAEFLPLSSVKHYSPGDTVTLIGEEAHHLYSVARIKQGEEVLLLDGNGGKFSSQVESCSKKSLTLRITSVETASRRYVLDLAIGSPKKEAMDDILRMSAELGIRKIIPLVTRHAFPPPKDMDRPTRIFINACKQANNPYLPLFEGSCELSAFSWAEYETVAVFTSREEALSDLKFKPMGDGAHLLVIGPEAGLTGEEEDFLLGLSNAKLIHLPSPILRSPTAVATAAGFFFSLLARHQES